MMVLLFYLVIMSKSAILEFQVTCVVRGVSGPGAVAGPLTVDEVSGFKADIAAQRQGFFDLVRPMAERAGFVFDSSLWSFKHGYSDPGHSRYCLWARIEWVDDGNVGKVYFWQLIRSTGLLQYGYRVVKAYG